MEVSLTKATLADAEVLWEMQKRSFAALLARYAALAKRVFTQGRLTVCLTDNMPKDYAAADLLGVHVRPVGEVQECVGARGKATLEGARGVEVEFALV